MPDIVPVVKQPLMNPDAIFAFVSGSVTLIAGIFTQDPHLTLALQVASGELALLGSVLHLDGK